MAQSKIKCDICQYDDEDNAMYGEMIAKYSFNVHYYCLLSGYNIYQRGKGNHGIFGFLSKDIVAGQKEFKNNQCYLCDKKSAAVKCCVPGCDRFWHFPCGRNNECITQFIGYHDSYCNDHVPDTNVINHIGKNAFCYVCYEGITSDHPATSIYSKCCKATADKEKEDGEEDVGEIYKIKFVHSCCVQRYVMTAGYDSMCIMCGMQSITKPEWQDQMRMRGIFVPRKDAEWEKDPNFQSHVKNKCSHANCPTPNKTKDVWCCRICGCIPLHLKCAGVDDFNDYLCHKCKDQDFVDLVPKF